jgi:hypothetical protein
MDFIFNLISNIPINHDFKEISNKNKEIESNFVNYWEIQPKQSSFLILFIFHHEF